MVGDPAIPTHISIWSLRYQLLPSAIFVTKHGNRLFLIDYKLPVIRVSINN